MLDAFNVWESISNSIKIKKYVTYQCEENEALLGIYIYLIIYRFINIWFLY